jgi:penicillin-binding protein 1B
MKARILALIDHGRQAARRLSRWRGRRAAIVVCAVAAIPLFTILGTMVEAGVRARLDPDDFLPPTRLYARPLVLRPGAPVSPDAIDATLKRLGYRRVSGRRVHAGEYYRASGGWIVGRRAFRLGSQLDPGGTTVVQLDPWRDRVRAVRDADGNRLPYAALEPELLRVTHAGRIEDRIPVPLEDMPQHLVDAVLTIEDQRFFEHRGIDLTRIGGATVANLQAGEVVEGASTVTQQLAKNLFLSPRRSVLRKVRELFMALALESRYDKEEILSAYLNEVYLGQDGALAVHGVGSAAQFYFGKDVSQLDLAESALLAGMIRGPSLYSPVRHPERAGARRDLVLRLLLERGLIDAAAFDRARARPLGLRAHPTRRVDGRYFTDFVARQLQQPHGGRALTQGLAVFTSLDLTFQQAAEEAVADGLRRLERTYPKLVRDDSPLQAALVAIDPRTGEVLAMVGGRDYGTSPFNRATQARRQPGSSFKPIVALAALSRPPDASSDSDSTFTLATTLADQPLTVETPAGVWQPVNYDRRFRGAITLRDALEQSLNVPFARLGLALGPERIVATARRLGIASPLHAVPSIALGASEVTPLEMARAYGVLAAEGALAPLNAVYAVAGSDGPIRMQFEERGSRPFRAEEAYLVTSALRGAVERGTGRGLRAGGYHGPVAAKSGTTNDFRDAWFIGYTPSLAVAVWVGFDDGRSLDLPGSRLALPIFADFLSEALGRDGGGEFRRPWGMDVVEIDPETGLRAGPGCRGRFELFIPGTAPTESCSPYWARYDARSGRSSRRVESRSLVRELLRMLDREHQ